MRQSAGKARKKRDRRVRDGRDAGFSLVEIMVGVFVVGAVGGAVGLVLVDALKTTRADQSRVRAAGVAAQEIETVRAALRSGGRIGNAATQSFPWAAPGCAASAVTCTKVVDGKTFTISRNAQLLPATGTQAARLQVAVSVTWPDMGSIAPVVNRTVMTSRGLDPGTPTTVTPGGGTGTGIGTGTAAVTVTVTGSAAAAISGKPVVLTGPSGSLQATTDTSGAAYFTGLPAGTYTASMTVANHIDQAGNATATSSAVTATNGTTQSVSLKYSPAATVTYTVTAPANYETYVNGTYPITTLNADLTGSLATRTVTPNAVNVATPVTTWPAASIIAWPGSCTADKPVSGFAVTAGGNASRTVALGAISATVKTGILVLGPLANADVYAVKDADTGCPATVTDPVDGGYAGAVVKFPNKTDSSGTAKLTLPPGTWRIKVKNHTPGLISGVLGWPSVTVTGGLTTSRTFNVDGL